VIPSQVMGILFGGVAGKGHDSLLGLVAGMLVMALAADALVIVRSMGISAHGPHRKPFH
jgi:hypothetical protein